MPVDAGNQPLPLGLIECVEGVLALRPGEVAAMESSLAEPNPRSVPHEEFDAVAPFVAKGVGMTFARVAA